MHNTWLQKARSIFRNVLVGLAGEAGVLDDDAPAVEPLLVGREAASGEQASRSDTALALAAIASVARRLRMRRTGRRVTLNGGAIAGSPQPQSVQSGPVTNISSGTDPLYARWFVST